MEYLYIAIGLCVYDEIFFICLWWTSALIDTMKISKVHISFALCDNIQINEEDALLGPKREEENANASVPCPHFV